MSRLTGLAALGARLAVIAVRLNAGAMTSAERVARQHRGRLPR